MENIAILLVAKRRTWSLQTCWCWCSSDLARNSRVLEDDHWVAIILTEHNFASGCFQQLLVEHQKGESQKEWTQERLQVLLLGAVKDILGHEVEGGEPLMAAGVNSRKAMELCDALETLLQVDIPTTLMFNYPSIDDMVRLSDSHMMLRMTVYAKAPLTHWAPYCVHMGPCTQVVVSADS